MTETVEDIDRVIRERIEEDLKLVVDFHPYIKNSKFTYDLQLSPDCPLGWDVSVYFHDKNTSFGIMFQIMECICKSIGITFYASCAEYEKSEDWFKISYCADLIGNLLKISH